MSSNEKKYNRDKMLDLICDCIGEMKRYPFSQLLDHVEEMTIPKIPFSDLQKIFNSFNISPNFGAGIKPETTNPVSTPEPTPDIKKSPAMKVMTLEQKEHFYTLFGELWSHKEFHGNMEQFKSEFELRVNKEFPDDVELQNLYIAYCGVEIENILNHMSFNLKSMKDKQDAKNTFVVMDFAKEVLRVKDALAQNQLMLNEGKLTKEKHKEQSALEYFEACHKFLDIYNSHFEEKEDVESDVELDESDEPVDLLDDLHVPADLKILPCPHCGVIPDVASIPSPEKGEKRFILDGSEIHGMATSHLNRLSPEGCPVKSAYMNGMYNSPTDYMKTTIPNAIIHWNEFVLDWEENAKKEGSDSE